MSDIIYDIAFSMDQSLTPIEKAALYERYGSSREILKLSKSFLKNILGRKWTGVRYKPEYFIKEAELMMPFIIKSGIKIVRFNEKDYPYSLRQIPDFPFILYYRGNIEYDYNKSVAVVGTRKPDNLGIDRAKKLSRTIIDNKGIIISGLALGIDSISHYECVKKHARTIAVMGCGIDRIYPAVHRSLARDILDNDGAIVSEYPPGVQPQRWLFPKRNRVIVGMSKKITIVQSPERSGSLISAMLCGDYNKELFVFSPIEGNKNDEGNKMLVSQGAVPIDDSCKCVIEGF